MTCYSCMTSIYGFANLGSIIDISAVLKHQLTITEINIESYPISSTRKTPQCGWISFLGTRIYNSPWRKLAELQPSAKRVVNWRQMKLANKLWQFASTVRARNSYQITVSTAQHFRWAWFSSKLMRKGESKIAGWEDLDIWIRHYSSGCSPTTNIKRNFNI